MTFDSSLTEHRVILLCVILRRWRAAARSGCTCVACRERMVGSCCSHMFCQVSPSFLVLFLFLTTCELGSMLLLRWLAAKGSFDHHRPCDSCSGGPMAREESPQSARQEPEQHAPAHVGMMAFVDTSPFASTELRNLQPRIGGRSDT